MENPITALSIVLLVLGLLVQVGVFNRIGTISTPEGLRRLGWTLLAAGLLVGLTQSEPAPREGSPAEQTRQ
jgi:protein-S-isoprenylcysteine O-methyltransferase Ste14